VSRGSTGPDGRKMSVYGAPEQDSYAVSAGVNIGDLPTRRYLLPNIK
jgi:hypothetical protein